MIITGAGKGLGRAYARYLAARGVRVVVNNRSHPGEERASADRVADDIRAAGGEAVADYSEITDAGAGERLLRRALDTWGRVDAHIANAGVSEGRSFHKQSVDEFRRNFEVNLFGTVNVLHPLFRHLYEQREGAVLLSTSVAGLYGEHGLPAYSSSKAALLGLTYALAHEGSGRGVRVNAIAPYAATQMTEAHLPETLRERMAPDYVAPVAAWLVDERCTLNGEIVISGAGRIARARMHETEGCRVEGTEPEAAGAALESLCGLPFDRTAPAAVEHFRRFVAGAPVTD
ncbi:MAG: SDR family NAD(P)-dependent oxidoreductase [Gammaproteobacteria bacterium]|nr:SDR family NAD(P)-dependent oxidoreductase [Gammaproteobacteria bacterium]